MILNWILKLNQFDAKFKLWIESIWVSDRARFDGRDGWTSMQDKYGAKKTLWLYICTSYSVKYTLVGYMNARCWSLTRIYIDQWKGYWHLGFFLSPHRMVNDTNAHWSMTRMLTARCKSDSVVNDTNAHWSMTRMPTPRLFCCSL